MKNWIINLIIGLFAIGIIIIVLNIALNNLTANESTLLSVLLTVLSIIGSWIVSSYFSKNAQKEAIEEVKREHQNNLRTYALNAAEKVDNLSNELTKLSLYLKSELEKNDESEEFALYSKIERIESAIHIINTLKSVNDTSLSDWKGVIGEELEEREEEKEEREERLLELTEKIENIINNQNNNKSKPNSELADIKSQLDYLSKTISPSFNIRASSSNSTKVKVEKKCPNCGAILTYTQREKLNGHKTIKCTSCGKRSISKYSKENGFYLTLEAPINESFNCPWCNNPNESEISNIPFTKEIIDCVSCQERIKVTRNPNLGLSINKFGNSSKNNAPISNNSDIEITQELLEKVETELPEQPWPEGIHKTISQKLQISNRTASKCIAELIKEGKFNPQINGVVYVKSET